MPRNSSTNGPSIHFRGRWTGKNGLSPVEKLPFNEVFDFEYLCFLMKSSAPENGYKTKVCQISSTMSDTKVMEVNVWLPKNCNIIYWLITLSQMSRALTFPQPRICPFGPGQMEQLQWNLVYTAEEVIPISSHHEIKPKANVNTLNICKQTNVNAT